MSIFFFLPMLVLTENVQTYTEEWTDAKRERTVPVRIFLPGDDLPGPFPVVVLSHGLGGSREGFGYLGNYWSKNGYVVVVLQHPGSDISIHLNRKSGESPRDRMKKAISVETAKDRYDDVQFVLDELERRNKDKGRLAGKLDLERIGMAGHSFGSQTTLAVIGRFPYKADPRIKAAIPMSPNKTKVGDQKRIHSLIKTPTLHLMGTKDDSPLEPNFDPNNRRIPFDSLSGGEHYGEHYLVNFQDGNHMLFSGHPRPLGLNKLEKKYQPLIAELTCKFLDAYLKDDREAKDWLQKDGLRNLMKDNGTVEMKPIGETP